MGNLKGYFLSVCYVKQIFTNGDRAHATEVLNRLGLRDCFEGIICFETLNPPSQSTRSNNKAAAISTTAKTPVVCKPSKEAIRQALRLAKADPQRTVCHSKAFHSHESHAYGFGLVFIFAIPNTMQFRFLL